MSSPSPFLCPLLLGLFLSSMNKDNITSSRFFSRSKSNNRSKVSISQFLFTVFSLLTLWERLPLWHAYHGIQSSWTFRLIEDFKLRTSKQLRRLSHGSSSVRQICKFLNKNFDKPWEADWWSFCFPNCPGCTHETPSTIYKSSNCLGRTLSESNTPKTWWMDHLEDISKENTKSNDGSSRYGPGGSRTETEHIWRLVLGEREARRDREENVEARR